MTEFDKQFIKLLNLKGKTLDVGSLNVNGDIKVYCKDFYIGIDMRKGKNVNIQALSQFLPFKSEVFDNIISIGTLEHDKEFWMSVKEMYRVLKVKGKLILSIPNYNFKYHAFPKDYWRFSKDSLNFFFPNGYNIWGSEINDNLIRVWGVK